jgi:hypothetical protein
MGAKLVKRLDLAWLDWLNALDRVPRERLSESGVCGHWSAKDLVGHMALWDSEVMTDIHRWQLGLPFPTNDWQTMNDDDHDAKANRPFDLLRVEMYSAHMAIRRELGDIQDDIDGEIYDRIAVDTWDHYPEHTQDVLTWLETNGGR